MTRELKRSVTFLAMICLSEGLAGAAIAEKTEDLVKLRDPFQKPKVVGSEKGEEKSELERIPVNKFKMIGVVTGPEKLKALLKGPDGKTFFVSKRERIGTKNGVIEKITPSAVWVKEQIKNVLGKKEWVTTKIKLPPEKEQK